MTFTNEGAREGGARDRISYTRLPDGTVFQLNEVSDGQGNWNYIDTRDTKIGCFIGDHTKTSIGTFFNSGAHVGVMTLLMGDGRVLPKFIPSFTWYLEGAVSSGFGYPKLLETAEVATSRRKRTLGEADKALLDLVYSMTRPERDKAVKKDRKKLLRR